MEVGPGVDPAEGSATVGCLSLRGDFAGGSLFAGPEFLEGAREVNVGRSSESFSVAPRWPCSTRSAPSEAESLTESES